MAQSFSRGFYNSKTWQKTRNAYYKYRNGLCEECLAKGLYVEGEIVHHNIELTPDNINNPMYSLDWDNLELVCRECHERLHGAHERRRYKIDAFGNVNCL